MSDERKDLPSASSCERLCLCPGSWNLEHMCTPESKTPDAITGTLIHEALCGDMTAFLALSDEDKEMAIKCENLAARIASDHLGNAGRMTNEKRLWIHDEDAQPIFSGKFDRLYRDDHRALIIDFKTGRGEVTHAQGNMQLRALAVLVSENYGANHIVVAIVQPWVSPQVTSCIYEQDDLIKSAIYLRDALEASKSPMAPRMPGLKQCEWCRAKPICPEANQQVLALAKTDLGDLQPAEVGRVLDACDLAEKVIESCRSRAKHLLEEDPLCIPGWHLKEGAKRRTITNPRGAFQAVSDTIATEDFMNCVSIKVAELERAFVKARGATAQAGKAEFNARLDGAMEVKASAPSLERTK